MTLWKSFKCTSSPRDFYDTSRWFRTDPRVTLVKLFEGSTSTPYRTKLLYTLLPGSRGTCSKIGVVDPVTDRIPSWVIYNLITYLRDSSVRPSIVSGPWGPSNESDDLHNFLCFERIVIELVVRKPLTNKLKNFKEGRYRCFYFGVCFFRRMFTRENY